MYYTAVKNKRTRKENEAGSPDAIRKPNANQF
jgi:hypothetical protein